MDGSSWRATSLSALGRALLRFLIALGSFYTAVPAVCESLAARWRSGEGAPPPGRPAGPPPGHPERLRPDLPMSPLERELSRQLSGPRPDRRTR